MNAREKMQILQESLMRELSVSDGDVHTAGFETDRLHATGESLKRKRHQAMSRCWPALMRSRCYDHDTQFAGFIKANPGVHPDGPVQDGATFAAFLLARGELGPSAEAELSQFNSMLARKRSLLYKLSSNLLSRIAWRT